MRYFADKNSHCLKYITDDKLTLICHIGDYARVPTPWYEIIPVTGVEALNRGFYELGEEALENIFLDIL